MECWVVRSRGTMHYVPVFTRLRIVVLSCAAAVPGTVCLSPEVTRPAHSRPARFLPSNRHKQQRDVFFYSNQNIHSWVHKGKKSVIKSYKKFHLTGGLEKVKKEKEEKYKGTTMFSRKQKLGFDSLYLKVLMFCLFYISSLLEWIFVLYEPKLFPGVNLRNINNLLKKYITQKCKILFAQTAKF